jgi:DeoR family transcriptional regulator, aga operon transcriptional repressor
MILDGESILLDSASISTDISLCLKEFPDRKITVMTNSMPVVIELTGNHSITLLFTGGEFQSPNKSFAGPVAEHAVRNYYFDKFFLGVDGMDLELGLTTKNPVLASLNQAMIERSKEVIGVVDSEKFGQRCFSKIGMVDVLDRLITDKKIDSDLENNLLSRGIEIVKV